MTRLEMKTSSRHYNHLHVSRGSQVLSPTSWQESTTQLVSGWKAIKNMLRTGQVAIQNYITGQLT